MPISIYFFNLFSFIFYFFYIKEYLKYNKLKEIGNAYAKEDMLISLLTKQTKKNCFKRYVTSLVDSSLDNCIISTWVLG